MLCLSALAIEQRVAPSTQNPALSALLFLYEQVLGTHLERIDGIVPARRPARVPVVLSQRGSRSLPRVVRGWMWPRRRLLAALRVLRLGTWSARARRAGAGRAHYTA